MVDLNNILVENSSGLVLSVKIVPNSSFSKIVDFSCDYIKIKIASPPVDNRANKELIEFCSNLFDINKSKISILSGDKSKIKKILIKDTKLDFVTQKILFVIDSLHKEKK